MNSYRCARIGLDWCPWCLFDLALQDDILSSEARLFGAMAPSSWRNSKCQDCISNLPADIFYRIFLQLGCRTLMSCRNVNRRFRDMVTTWPEYSTYERYRRDLLRLHGLRLKQMIQNRPRALRGLLQTVRNLFAYFWLQLSWKHPYSSVHKGERPGI